VTSTVASLTGANALVAKKWAVANDKHVGSGFELITPSGTRQSAVVRGIYDDGNGLLADVTLPNEVLSLSFSEQRDVLLLASLARGADATAVRGSADRALRRSYPSIEVRAQRDFVSTSGRHSTSLGLVPVLFVLAGILIAAALVVRRRGTIDDAQAGRR